MSEPLQHRANEPLAVGRWTRLGQALQVSLAAVLALGAALLAVELSSDLYLRWDFSRDGRNTLAPEVGELIEALPEPVTVDVFFRPLVPPYDAISAEVQNRMLELLFVARHQDRARVEVSVHDVTDLEAVQARQEELGVQGMNLIVLSCGGRRTSLSLFGDVAAIDWGNPTRRGLRYLADLGLTGLVNPREYSPLPRDFRPAELSAFRGQEAFAQALLKVAAGDAPKVYFVAGHGEPELDGTTTADVGRLSAALRADGFELATWNPSDGPLPGDATVVALIGARQPLEERELQAVRAFVEAGGRVIAAPGREDVERGFERGVAALLTDYGMIPQPGIVCEPVRDRFGQTRDGLPECALLVIEGSGLSPSHPLTEPLRRRGRRLSFSLTHSFRRGGLGSGGILLDLVHAPAEAWRDAAGERGPGDFVFDSRQEERGRHRLVMLAQLSAAVPTGGGELKEGRVLGIAGASFFTNGTFDVNRDFLLNAFNWMAEREHLVRVSPREARTSRLDVQRGRALAFLNYGLLGVVPALCMLVGLVLAWRRRG